MSSTASRHMPVKRLQKVRKVETMVEEISFRVPLDDLKDMLNRHYADCIFGPEAIGWPGISSCKIEADIDTLHNRLKGLKVTWDRVPPPAE